MPLSYSDYLRLEPLLTLQTGFGATEGQLAPHELLFIIVHQVDELWFKLTLHELEQVRDLFARERVDETEVARATASLRRIVKTFELAAAHFALMETMSPRDFLDFRAKLGPASGFQSPQFREIEIVMGLPEAARVRLGNEKSVMEALAPKAGMSGWAAERVRRREGGITLKSALDQWLHRTPIDGSSPGDPDDARRVDAFLDAYLACHAREVDASLALARAGGLANSENVEQLVAQYEAEKQQAALFLRTGDDVRSDPVRRRIRAAAIFIESYRELPLLAWPRELLDLIVQLEQSFLVFRQRHARMVERMIGRRVGTGGSDGVQYLDATALQYRVFEELWKVRRLLVRQGAVPPLANAASYGFRAAP